MTAEGSTVAEYMDRNNSRFRMMLASADAAGNSRASGDCWTKSTRSWRPGPRCCSCTRRSRRTCRGRSHAVNLAIPRYPHRGGPGADAAAGRCDFSQAWGPVACLGRAERQHTPTDGADLPGPRSVDHERRRRRRSQYPPLQPAHRRLPVRPLSFEAHFAWPFFRALGCPIAASSSRETRVASFGPLVFSGAATFYMSVTRLTRLGNTRRRGWT
jgi:hypothetical protein